MRPDKHLLPSLYTLTYPHESFVSWRRTSLFQDISHSHAVPSISTMASVTTSPCLPPAKDRTAPLNKTATCQMHQRSMTPKVSGPGQQARAMRTHLHAPSHEKAIRTTMTTATHVWLRSIRPREHTLSCAMVYGEGCGAFVHKRAHCTFVVRRCVSWKVRRCVSRMSCWRLRGCYRRHHGGRVCWYICW